MIKIKVVGDIMPGGILNKKKISFISDRVLAYLKDADIRIGTLECGIGNEPSFCQIKSSKGSSAFVYAEDEDLQRLKILDINAVSLANNHFFDLGKKGAEHTISLLKKNGILYFGAGMDLKEAQQPAVFKISGKTFAFIGFCDTNLKYCQFATENSPGINPLEKDNIIELIKSAKEKFNYVFAVVHWGKEHTWWPSPHVIKYAKILQKAGVSGIIGDHPHRVQSVCKINQCPIAFSLGNFLFPDRFINTPYVTYYPLNLDEIKSMPTVHGFTRVKQPSLKLWPDISNIGMILEIHCGDNSNIEMDYKLSEISHTGFIDFISHTGKIERILNITKPIILNIFYSSFFTFCKRFSNLLSRTTLRIKRIIKI